MRRAGETPFRDMKQLVPPLCDALLASGAVSGSTPWAVFGHSMGSAVTFEFMYI
jgi:surfactin synthase thioesterase subunit